MKARAKRGFTLIEILIVVVILAIIKLFNLHQLFL